MGRDPDRDGARRPRRRLARLAWTVAGAALAVFAVRTYVGDVYRVESGSMEPTLRAGEHVFVRYGLPELRRFDVLALRSPEDDSDVVKRVVGLPGESVVLAGGDLRIGGRPLDPAVPRPEPVVLFDSREHGVEDFFLHGTARLDPWRRVSAGTWRLEARDVAAGTDGGLMCTREPVADAHRDAAGALAGGTAAVDDVGFAAELRWLAGDGRVRVRLGASWDTYQLSLETGDGDGDEARPRAVLTARAERGERVLAEAPLDLAPGDGAAWHRLEFRLLDGHAVACLDGTPLLTAELPPPREVDPTAPKAPPGGRCCFGGEGVTVEWRAIRVLRDLHWPLTDPLGPGVAWELGPDEVFVLGDDASGSRDSRVWGPVELDRILGRAEAVVWPPGRLRRVRGASPVVPAAPRPRE